VSEGDTTGCAKKLEENNRIKRVEDTHTGLAWRGPWPHLIVQCGITSDQQVGAPGHGKDIMDDVNAVDKNHILKCCCMTNMPNIGRVNGRGFVKSVATECQPMRLLDEQISGVKGDVKRSK
jgi:hypothetical protein